MKDIKEIFRKVFCVTMDFYDRNPRVAVTAFIRVPMRTWMQDKSYNRHDDLTILKQIIIDAKNNNKIDPSLSFRLSMPIIWSVTDISTIGIIADCSSMMVGRLSYQANAKGCTNLINSVKSRFGIRFKCFI